MARPAFRKWLLLLLWTPLSCSHVVEWATATPAPWSYVEDAWGGLTIGSPSLQGNLVVVPINLFRHEATRIDSGICVHAIHAKADAGRVLLSLEQSVCGPAALTEVTARLGKPRSGRYVVVYDDRAAGYPVIGEIEVE